MTDSPQADWKVVQKAPRRVDWRVDSMVLRKVGLLVVRREYLSGGWMAEQTVVSTDAQRGFSRVVKTAGPSVAHSVRSSVV